MPRSLAILFADICDSVRLYEAVGDAEAQRLAEECLQRLAGITQGHRGAVIRTQGDGILCKFLSADEAFDAAVHMQDVYSDETVTIAVGLNYGPVIEKDEDVFGDVVNLAARVMSLARSGEVLITEDMIRSLSNTSRRNVRFFDRASVKGKSEPVNIYSVRLSDDPEDTMLSDSKAISEAAEQSNLLVLTHHGTEVMLAQGAQRLLIGRESNCDVVVDNPMASRRHAIVEAKRGQYILTDQSTNGTLITSEHGEPIFLKRESLPLMRSGTIAIGRKSTENKQDIIHYAHISV